jgi:hypothetical protein
VKVSIQQRIRNIFFVKLRELACEWNLSILRRVFRLAQERRFTSNLGLLHDTLEGTDFSWRYWIWGGLLLGWAREKRILPHDHPDADFAYFHEDREHFLAVVERIIQAGFIPLFKFKNNDGLVTQHSFAKDGVKFEFFEMYRQENGIRYWLYSASEAVEIMCEVPPHGLEKICFLGKTWLKPDDHEQHLRAVYGNWLEPNPDYDSARDSRSIRKVHKWLGGLEWR